MRWGRGMLLPASLIHTPSLSPFCISPLILLVFLTDQKCLLLPWLL